MRVAIEKVEWYPVYLPSKETWAQYKIKLSPQELLEIKASIKGFNEYQGLIEERIKAQEKAGKGFQK